MQDKQLQNDTQKPTQAAIIKSSSKNTAKASDRWVAIMMILERHQLDKGLAPLEEIILVAKAKSWEDLLSYAKVPATRYSDVYREAMLYYEDKGPLSPHDMMAAWGRIRDRENYSRRHAPIAFEDRQLPEKRNKCKVCGGSRIYMQAGRIVYTEETGRRFPAKCPACLEQPVLA